MAKIEVTPEMLKGKSTELNSLRGEHEAVMARITNLVNGLSDQWSGDAQRAFLQSFTEMKPTFDNFVRILQGYSDLMVKAAGALEETDRQIGGSISSFQ